MALIKSTNKVEKIMDSEDSRNGGKIDFKGEGSESVMLEQEKWQNRGKQGSEETTTWLTHSSSTNRAAQQLRREEETHARS